MLMKDRYPCVTSDIECYRQPMCFELAGRALDICLDGGESVTLAFSDYPGRKVTLNGARETYYDCAKIADKILFISFVDAPGCVSLVPDLETGAVTRVLTRADGESDIAFGSLGVSPARHGFTNDLRGNTVTWVLGTRDDSAFRLNYGDTVTFTSARRGAADEAASFRAVKIADALYLQSACVGSGAEKSGVCMVSDFRRVLCTGSVYSASKYMLFGGYGRVESP